MEKRRDISTTHMVEDIFFRDWRKKESDVLSKDKAKKRKEVGGPIVEWVKYPNCMDKSYFKFARVGDVFINQGDNILIPAEERNNPAQIAFICYMFNDPLDNDKMCHAHFYCRGTDTILGDKSDPRELFLVDHCEDIPISTIIGKAKVHHRVYNPKWHVSGGIDRPNINDSDDGKNYYFSKRYDYNTSRFVDFVNDHKSKCMSCLWQKEEEEFDIASIQFYEESVGHSFVKWRNEKYFVGTGVFIDYERVTTRRTKGGTKENETCEKYYTLETINSEEVWMTPLDRETLFPEKYRNADKRQESPDNPCEPYTVGVIEKILRNKKVKIREFYRVEDTGEKKYGNPYLVYWTNKIYTISNLEKWKAVVKGKCYVENKERIINEYQWIKEGPFRFYYELWYNPDTDIIKKLPPNAKNIERSVSNCNGDLVVYVLFNKNYKVYLTTKGLRTRKKSSGYSSETASVWPESRVKLKSMDIYAGCGGLSDGLERAGLVDTRWAIEMNASAAKSFQMNHPSSLVHEQNCNDVLCMLLEGKGGELNMPEKGEVDIIVGGPPCQGYSVINRFRTAESAKQNNSQINTYLGFIDYYRPKYFIFENVRNFVSFNGTAYLKLTLKCLLEIGYQVTFGVLQAGNYGLPQSRRRFFIIGAAPGLVLPKLPEPTHCFGRFEKNVESIIVDNLKYDIGDSAIGVLGSLPYRRVTIRDAIKDLPYTDYDSMSSEMSYQEPENMSFYAKNLREYCNRAHIVTEHECNYASAIVKKRIESIPQGGDWTDLPNAGLPLEDGTTTDILEYSYRTKGQKAGDHPRGVCACAENKPCDKLNKYSRSTTLIPWSIAHTADRNNNWRGIYGRLEWDGYFGTVTTNPEPTRTQGRVLHPEQNRILSIREYARAQGFHDEFLFADSTTDKYRQIGNAVPPILATAIGREIAKTLASQRKK